jgi:hypothetical protein
MIDSDLGPKLLFSNILYWGRVFILPLLFGFMVMLLYNIAGAISMAARAGRKVSKTSVFLLWFLAMSAALGGWSLILRAGVVTVLLYAVGAGLGNVVASDLRGIGLTKRLWLGLRLPVPLFTRHVEALKAAPGGQQGRLAG